MPASNSYDALIERFISERLTADEIPLFFSFLEEEGFRLRYAERIDLDFLEEAWLGWSNEEQRDRIYNNILEAGNIPLAVTGRQKRTGRPMRRLFPWLRSAAAAALVVLLSTVAYRLLQKTTPGKRPPVVASLPAVKDVPPGGNKAVLILDDKSVVPLDSLANGAAVIQGGMQIVKGANGEIHYVPAPTIAPEANGKPVKNTVRTPRGGQYQLTLSDGTKVWLNAASSISFPARFPGSGRNVSITGEVYFEVAENAAQPFVVSIGGHNSVEVLGTHFNINGYDDEKTVKTTLLEGKVKVTQGEASVVLLPGQQSSGTQVTNTIDVSQVMAWKNKVFSFEGKTLQQVLRELARWYDLTIIYEKGIPDVKLRGEMGMNLNLLQVIKGLEAMELKCRLEEGNKLVILPSE